MFTKSGILRCEQARFPIRFSSGEVIPITAPPAVQLIPEAEKKMSINRNSNEAAAYTFLRSDSPRVPPDLINLV